RQTGGGWGAGGVASNGWWVGRGWRGSFESELRRGTMLPTRRNPLMISTLTLHLPAHHAEGRVRRGERTCTVPVLAGLGGTPGNSSLATGPTIHCGGDTRCRSTGPNTRRCCSTSTGS